MKEIEEGKVKIKVDEGRPYDKKVFYNPKMEFDRNLSISIADLVQPKELCDSLAATGIRGIRYLKESRVPEVWINDASPKATNLIKNNCKLNDVNCIVKNKDAAVLLREKMFDYIDVDPFGSPAEFFDSASSSIKDNGFLGITATDTYSFFGTYPRVSIRRYGRKSINTDYNKELGLRILVSSLIESLDATRKRSIQSYVTSENIMQGFTAK